MCLNNNYFNTLYLSMETIPSLWSDFSFYAETGLTGLANLGNTCFLNSTLQCLSHTYELNGFLNQNTYQQKINKKPESLLLIEWDKLRQMMWSENCTIAPGAFVQSIQKIAKIKGKDIFTGWAQNDLPEFLLFLIESFHSALMREVEMNIKGSAMNEKDNLAKICYEMMKKMYRKEYSEILSIFYGIHVSQIKDLEGNVLSRSPEPFFSLELPIPHDKDVCSLYDCFDLYSKPECLSDDNAWYNEKTEKKQDVNKNFIFWCLPNIMIITLKRFSNDNKKNQNLIDFPLENLDLTKYVEGYNSGSYVYDLYGICNHQGSVLGGHYTAYVKNANQKWYLFNDTNVKEIDDKSNLISDNAYCFFYRKKN